MVSLNIKSNNKSLKWKYNKDLVPYDEAINTMENYVQKIYKDKASELIWLLEHPSVYTCGTSAKGAAEREARREQLLESETDMSKQLAVFLSQIGHIGGRCLLADRRSPPLRRAHHRLRVDDETLSARRRDRIMLARNGLKFQN